MKLRLVTLLLIGLFSMTLLPAQDVGKRVERRAKHRAESKVNQKVDRTVDQAVDDVFNGLFGKKKKKKKTEEVEPPTQADEEAYEEAEAQRDAAIAARIMGQRTEPWEPVKNDFPISFDMSITAEEKGKASTSQISYTFDTWLLGMQMKQEEGETMLVVFDNEKGTMTTVIEQDGKRQGYRMNRGALNQDAMDEQMDDIKITPTGNSKMIDDYFCREYLIETKQGTTNAWLTKEIQADMNQLYSGFVGAAKGRKQDNNMMIYQQYGVLIEATTVEKDGKTTTHTKVSNIKTGDAINRGIFDIGDVEIADFGN